MDTLPHRGTDEPLEDADLSFSVSDRAAVLTAANELAEIVELTERPDRALASAYMRAQWEDQPRPELSSAAQAVVTACEDLLRTLDGVGMRFGSIENLWESLYLGVPPHFDHPEFDFLLPLLERL